MDWNLKPKEFILNQGSSSFCIYNYFIHITRTFIHNFLFLWSTIKSFFNGKPKLYIPFLINHFLQIIHFCNLNISYRLGIRIKNISRHLISIDTISARYVNKMCVPINIIFWISTIFDYYFFSCNLTLNDFIIDDVLRRYN